MPIAPPPPPPPATKSAADDRVNVNPLVPPFNFDEPLKETAGAISTIAPPAPPPPGAQLDPPLESPAPPFPPSTERLLPPLVEIEVPEARTKRPPPPTTKARFPCAPLSTNQSATGNGERPLAEKP